MNHRLEWRVYLVLVIFCFVAGLVMFRLFQKQIFEHDVYAEASLKQSTSVSSEPAQRGRIFAIDKDGNRYPLAVSEWTYQLQVIPRQISNKQSVADSLSKMLPSIGTSQKIYDLINNDNAYVPALLKGIDETEADKIINANLPGVILVPELARNYPEGDKLAAQIVGFIGGDGDGKYGVEGYYNKELAGSAGSQKSKNDSFGKLIDILSNDLSQPGGDAILSIDNNVQFTVEQKLKEAIDKYKADSGSVVVMNASNGEIVAMAGDPTYDPNNYSKIASDQQRVYLSPAASDQYEAGSVIKPITMSMAIDLGLVEPDTTDTFGKTVTVLDHEIHNAENKVFGKETMTQVLENSDNVAMVWVSNKIGNSNMKSYFDKYGFGKNTGVDIIGEQPGSVPDIKDWNDILRANSAFGQGIAVTPLQIASSYCVLANGGKTVTPHVVKSIQYSDHTDDTKINDGTQIIKPETAAKLRDMLVSVVVKGEGKKAAVSGIQVAGKTGTAQIFDPTTGKYSDTDQIGTFAGFFPADKPQYVMVVRLNRPKTVKYAESSAAPTFGDIAQWMVNYYGIK